MKKLLYMMLVSAIVLACTKKNTVRISVKDVVTGKPIPGASIYISEIFNVSDGVSGSKTEKFYSGNTNSEGLLYVPKRFNNHRTYNIYASLDTVDVCWQNSYGYLGTKDNFKKGFDFEFASCAFIQLNINNINCQGAGDHFVLYSEGTQVDITNAGLMIDEMGCYQYNPPGYSKIPMGGRYYRWEVTRNGITTTFRDTAYFAEGEYKTYTINY